MNDPQTSTLSDAHRALLDDFRAGRRVALSRTITLIENERPGFDALLHELHGRLGRAHRIGITGPPGAGKSTLTAALIRAYRERGERVAVIAVDPTSPFTGGALLGDRIRMNELSMDPDVFVRSMATRGSLGGLAMTTQEVADAMDAFGFDRVLIETVGVGQSELDVAGAADSAVVVLVPESGDSIQAMKAGLMEAADLFVINKSDRPGADRLAREIGMMLQLRLRDGHQANVPAHHGVDMRRIAARRAAVSAPAPVSSAPDTSHPAGDDAAAAHAAGWSIPVLQTVAHTGDGVAELVATLDRHAGWLEQSGEALRRRGRRHAARVRAEVDRIQRRRVWRDGPGAALLREAGPELVAGDASPYQVAERIVRAADQGADG
jgi:LAO/AO transport system kinase